MREKPLVYIPMELETRNKLKERKGVKRYDEFISDLLESAEMKNHSTIK